MKQSTDTLLRETKQEMAKRGKLTEAWHIVCKCDTHKINVFV